MREYGRVQTGFWSHHKVRSLSEDGRIAAFYLLTSPHSNSIGSYLLPDWYAADDLQWKVERVHEAFAELFAKGFARRFEDGRHIAICDFAQWNKAENPNVVKAMVKQFDQLPNDPARIHAARGILDHGGWVTHQDRRRLETLCEQLSKGVGKTPPEPFRKPEPEPEPEPGLVTNSSSILNGSNTSSVGSIAARASDENALPSSAGFGLEGQPASDNGGGQQGQPKHYLLESLHKRRAAE